jgi:hypothetical protein
MKTLIGVNTLTEVDSSVYLSHCQMWYRLGKEYPDDKFIFYTPHRLSIDNMRNGAVNIALSQECDYLMFIDDDMILHPNCFTSLLNGMKKYSADVMMALTFIRSYPFKPMFFRSCSDGKLTTDLKVYDDYADHVDESGYIRCNAIGCACVLFNVERCFKQMVPPYFLTIPGRLTEDIYFCLKLEQLHDGKDNIHIYVDTNVPTGHLMERDVAHVESVDKLRIRFKEDSPNTERDHGNAYAKYIEALNDTESGMRVE